jgi:Tol biopolymer transport system component
LSESVEFKGAFSPDGKEYYFYRHALPDVIPALFVTELEGGVWTRPSELGVAQGARTSHPHVSEDNQWLFFRWQFKRDENRASGFYASARTDSDWSEPQYVGPGMYLTSDASGALYTTESVWGETPKHYLARASFSDGRLEVVERLEIEPHYENQTHPCIARDGSYIIYDANVEGGSLFVSFRDPTGAWLRGIDLTEHGFKPDTRGAYISPDGKYLFFSYAGDIWWVDIELIEGLRPTNEE